MGTLEKVMELRREGQNDPQIIESLRQQRISPKEISEALSQSKIKSMLDNEQASMLQQTSSSFGDTTPKKSEEDYLSEAHQMQPSMMGKGETEQYENPNEGEFTQPVEEQDFQDSSYPPLPGGFQQEYPEYQEYQPQGANIETINEISEQIIEEKTSQLKKQINSLARFKEETDLETQKLNERVSRIENTLNELQVAILRKIGEYGESIKDIAKEMHSTQDSFSKILNPLTDNIRELQNMTGSEIPKNKPKPKIRTNDSRSNFEDYLR